MNKVKTTYSFSIAFSFIIILSTIFGCKNNTPKQHSFAGEKAAVRLADQMFETIGGKEAWCDLKSLYIKAEHNEPQMDRPYQSEIWRALDRFELIIEQQNDSFHVKGVFSDSLGRVRYYDKRDTFRDIAEELLEEWSFDHRHNIYVILHDLACTPEEYRVEMNEESMLSFYRDSAFVARLGLDEQLRPYLFYHPNYDGSTSGSIFTHWGKDGRLVHSAGGHPLDSSFIYRTEIWQGSNKTLKESFGEELFETQ